MTHDELSLLTQEAIQRYALEMTGVNWDPAHVQQSDQWLLRMLKAAAPAEAAQT